LIGVNAKLYTMDLKFNGVYRMTEVNKFDFPRNAVNDLLLTPAIMEVMIFIKVINMNFFTSLTKT
jgi:hypothetical protein